MLTALVTTPPLSAAVTCSAVTTPARSWASAVEAPRWGVTTTSSRAKIGCSVKGSEGKTSSAAPPSLPDSRPAISASRSTSSPRAQLTRRAPSFIAAIVSVADQADRLRRLRHVQGDQVGAAEDLLDAVEPLDPELAEALGGDELVEGDDVHLEALGALGDELADAAEADHAEGLAVELGALELGAVPAPGDQRFVRLRDVAEEGQSQRQRVLGGGDRVRLGRVGDDDAAAGGGGDVDVVDAGAGAADHLQVGRQLDQLRRHLRRRADQDRVVLADLRAQLVVGHVEAEIDVEVGAQQVDAGVGDLLLDQNSHRATPSTLARTQSMQAVSASTSAGSTAGNMPDPQLVAAELAVGLDVDDAVGAQGGGEGGGVDRVVEVDRADDQRALGRVGDEGSGDVAGLGPAVEAAGAVGGALDAPVEAAAGEHPLDLVGQQQQGRQRRRVVGLLLARVVERRLQREEFRLPAAGGAVELLDPGDRGRARAAASQRPPSAPKDFCGAK